MVYFEQNWGHRTKQDYYLAQIAAEIRAFREGFSKNPKDISVADLLIDFKLEAGNGKPVEKVVPFSEDEAKHRSGIETGPDAIKDPKWARTNAIAKSAWMQRLGLKELPQDVSPEVGS